MQNLTTKQIRILIIVVLLADLAAVFYMNIVLGLSFVPLQALPPLYWMLLFIPLIVVFMSTAVTSSAPSKRTIVSISTRFYVDVTTLYLGGALTLAGVFFLMAFVNNLAQPGWGGNTAIFIFSGCMQLVLGYAFYRGSRVLK